MALATNSQKNSSSSKSGLLGFLEVFRFTRSSIRLVWETSPQLLLFLALLTVLGGIFPAGLAYVSKLIVDEVLLAIETGQEANQWKVAQFIALELGFVVVIAAIRRGLSVCQSLLRAMLGFKVNVIILEKALTLELAQYEDSEFYDKMTQARRGASTRPLGLINKTFGLVQNAISLFTYGALLYQFSLWAVLILFLAALPAFFGETKFSGDAFRLFRWRVPEAREQNYLELLITREDSAKEVKLFGLGSVFLERYMSIFDKLFREDRALTLRRGQWGFLLGLISTVAFYGAYGWIAWETITKVISLGGMTMYILLFKQGQAAITSGLSAISGMYEDNLYLSNLYEFLEYETRPRKGSVTDGAQPGDGIRFEAVSFTYPGQTRPALKQISFHLKAGEKLALVGENGSGKTTLIKLLTRLYEPTEGQIRLDGTNIQDWNIVELHKRIGVIFQDYVRYQLSVGENIGVGDVRATSPEEKWLIAAEKGMSLSFIETMPKKFQTQLGRWFRDGQELSLGQWQKIALSRAFMRSDADVLVLDEPTASMDAEAEAMVFQRFRELTENQMVLLISHRFSTVRMADQIMVLHEGALIEEGNHAELLQLGGRYARLFKLQAAGYQ